MASRDPATRENGEPRAAARDLKSKTVSSVAVVIGRLFVRFTGSDRRWRGPAAMTVTQSRVGGGLLLDCRNNLDVINRIILI